MPAYASARERARAISCASNMKQLGIAFIAYTMDYDDTMPLVNLPSPDGTNQPWDAALYKFVREPGVFRCLDDPNNPDLTGFPAGSPSYYGQVRSYAVNFPGSNVTTTRTDPRSPMGQILSAITAPSTSILLAEFFSCPSSEPPVQGLTHPENRIGDTFNDATEYSLTPSVTQMHNGGSNYLFCDGHYKHLRIEQTAPDTPGMGITRQAGLVPPATDGYWDIRQ